MKGSTVSRLWDGVGRQKSRRRVSTFSTPPCSWFTSELSGPLKTSCHLNPSVTIKTTLRVLSSVEGLAWPATLTLSDKETSSPSTQKIVRRSFIFYLLLTRNLALNFVKPACQNLTR